MQNYTQCTTEDILFALQLFDHFDIVSSLKEKTGYAIAQDMLDGVVEFTEHEIEQVANYKNVSVEFLITNDEKFKKFTSNGIGTKIMIATKLIHSGADISFVAEICELSLNTVKDLIN